MHGHTYSSASMFVVINSSLYRDGENGDHGWMVLLWKWRAMEINLACLEDANINSSTMSMFSPTFHSHSITSIIAIFHLTLGYSSTFGL